MLLIGLLLSLASDSILASDTLFVNASAVSNGNGNSWATAFRSMHKALAAANAGDEVWVVNGTYPVSSEVLNVGNGIQLYGGFTGREYIREQRNWLRHETILQAEPGTGPIIYVAGADSTTLMDGFTLRGAASGAMVLFEASPTIRNCRFINNAADSGGAILIDRCRSVVLKNCVFEKNTATIGGAVAYSGNDPQQSAAGHRIENCVFVSNRAEVSGGAVFMNLEDDTVSILSSVFVHNEASRTAGAAHAVRGVLVVVNTTCFGNRAFSPLTKALTFHFGDGGSLVNNIIWNGHADLSPNILVVKGAGGSSSFSHAQNLIEKDFFYGTVQGQPEFEDTSAMSGADGWWGTVDDGLHVQASSAAINAGVNHPLVWTHATDVASQRRRMFGRLGVRRPELGAYERWTGASMEELCNDLVAGRLVVLMRHAEARAVRTAEDVACKEIPGLTDRGRSRADELSRVLQLLGIEPGEVLTGDACGMRQTAAALWPTWTPQEQWLAGADTSLHQVRLDDLSRVPVGGCRFIVTSADVIGQMWRGEQEQMMELDALLVRPLGTEGYQIVAHWAYETFMRLNVP